MGVQMNSNTYSVVYNDNSIGDWSAFFKPGGNADNSRVQINSDTVESRYLELGYLEFCAIRIVYLNQKYILITFSNHKLAL